MMEIKFKESGLLRHPRGVHMSLQREADNRGLREEPLHQKEDDG